jgi:ABC-2 type transport system ATP-binding protein
MELESGAAIGQPGFVNPRHDQRSLTEERKESMSNNLILMTQGLVKFYGSVQALRGVDLAVEQGEIFGFLGPNGAGKTTTIRCLLDLIRPQGGQIRVLGMDPQVDPLAVRARVGYLPGELNVELNMTAEAVLRYFNDLRGKKADWTYVQELARRLKLDMKVPIKNLSKGNKQKVGVVQALMARPELLLLDEPTAGLDPLMQQEVYRMLREARTEGATIFFSSHIIAEVEAIADRIAIIRQGTIVEVARPEQLINMNVQQVRVHFKNEVNLAPLAAVTGVSLVSHNGADATLRVEGEMDGLVKALAAFPVSSLETARPSLEDAFLAYYAAGDREEE